MGAFANNEDPDEMLQNMTFHQGTVCLDENNLQRQVYLNLKILTCDPLKSTMKYPRLNLSNFIKVILRIN